MNTIKAPDLGTALASIALRRAFRQRLIPLSLEELVALCASETHPRILAGYLRWQREEINRILVHVLLESMDKLEAEFLRRHYRDGKSMHYLSMRLPASERQLYCMNERILSRLSSLLFYRPSLADAYFPRIPYNLLSILDMRLSTFALRVDVPVDEGWLDALQEARNVSRELLSFMDSFRRAPLGASSRAQQYQRVIHAKLRDPFASVQEIVDEIGDMGLTASVAHAYLGTYQRQIKKILNPKKFAVFKNCKNL